MEGCGLIRTVAQIHLLQLEPGECVILAEWMHQAGYSAAAGRLHQEQHASAYQYLLDAVDQARDPATAARARTALGEISIQRGRR